MEREPQAKTSAVFAPDAATGSIRLAPITKRPTLHPLRQKPEVERAQGEKGLRAREAPHTHVLAKSRTEPDGQAVEPAPRGREANWHKERGQNYER